MFGGTIRSIDYWDAGGEGERGVTNIFVIYLEGGGVEIISQRDCGVGGS